MSPFWFFVYILNNFKLVSYLNILIFMPVLFHIFFFIYVILWFITLKILNILTLSPFQIRLLFVYLEWILLAQGGFAGCCSFQLVFFECLGIFAGGSSWIRVFTSLFCFLLSPSFSLLIPSHLTALQLPQILSLSLYTTILGSLSPSDMSITEEPVAGPEGGLAQDMAVWGGVISEPRGVFGDDGSLRFLAQRVVCRESWRECSLVPVHGF